MNEIDSEKTLYQKGYYDLSFLKNKPIQVYTKNHGIQYPDYLYYDIATDTWFLQFK